MSDKSLAVGLLIMNDFNHCALSTLCFFASQNDTFQWRQRLGNFGAMDWRKDEGILGDGSHPVGSMGEDPIRGLVDEPPKLILILEMDVKLTF